MSFVLVVFLWIRLQSFVFLNCEFALLKQKELGKVKLVIAGTRLIDGFKATASSLIKCSAGIEIAH